MEHALKLAQFLVDQWYVSMPLFIYLSIWLLVLVRGWPDWRKK